MIPLLLLAAFAIPPQDEPEPWIALANKAVGHGVVMMQDHIAAKAPRADNGLWLDENGRPSARVTALGVLIWASEDSFYRHGPYREDVRRSCRALLGHLDSPEWEETPRAERLHDEVLIALALFVQARMCRSHALHCELEWSLAEVFSRERLRCLFPDRSIPDRSASSGGVSDTSQDGTRILCLLLWKQVQVSRSTYLLGARLDIVAPDVPAMDDAPMRQWIDRCTKEKSLSAERQLLLFMGQLWFYPPAEHPLKAGITGLLWKRAQSAMALEQAKAGQRSSASLLFVDTVLRNEFLTHAFPTTLREHRQHCLSALRDQLEKALTKKRGLSQEDLHVLLTLPFTYNYARWWDPMPRKLD